MKLWIIAQSVRPPSAISRSTSWTKPVALLSFGTFIVGTDAHSVAGLLPEMAAAMETSIGVAGQSVTVFAISYALLAPVLAVTLARHRPRHNLLLALGVFAAGNLLTAAAGSMPVLLVGRAVAAAGAALFTPTAGAMAARLAGPERRGPPSLW